MMNSQPIPLTKAQQNVLKKVLPKSFKPFIRDNWEHEVHAKRYYEVWIEMPGMPEQYASLGFTYGPEAPYWTVPMPNRGLIDRFMAAGYGDDYKRFLWRYVDLSAEFWSMPESQQVAWFTKYIEDSLREDEQLRGK